METQTKNVNQTSLEDDEQGFNESISTNEPPKRGHDESQNDESLQPAPKRPRFEIYDETDNSWELEKNMVEYINKHFNVFIPNQTLIEGVMKESPIPKNVAPIKKIDICLN